MDSLEDKLSSVLANPEMMSQIMAMAQTMGMSEGKKEHSAEPPPAADSAAKQAQNAPGTNIDSEMLKKIFSATQQANIDKNQLGLLRALTPYLCESRIAKLEKAMRAAKIAGFAALALNSKGKGW